MERERERERRTYPCDAAETNSTGELKSAELWVGGWAGGRVGEWMDGWVDRERVDVMPLKQIAQAS